MSLGRRRRWLWGTRRRRVLVLICLTLVTVMGLAAILSRVHKAVPFELQVTVTEFLIELHEDSTTWARPLVASRLLLADTDRTIIPRDSSAPAVVWTGTGGAASRLMIVQQEREMSGPGEILELGGQDSAAGSIVVEPLRLGAGSLVRFRWARESRTLVVEVSSPGEDSPWEPGSSLQVNLKGRHELILDSSSAYRRDFVQARRLAARLFGDKLRLTTSGLTVVDELTRPNLEVRSISFLREQPATTAIGREKPLAYHEIVEGTIFIDQEPSREYRLRRGERLDIEGLESAVLRRAALHPEGLQLSLSGRSAQLGIGSILAPRNAAPSWLDFALETSIGQFLLALLLAVLVVFLEYALDPAGKPE